MPQGTGQPRLKAAQTVSIDGDDPEQVRNYAQATGLTIAGDTPLLLYCGSDGLELRDREQSGTALRINFQHALKRLKQPGETARKSLLARACGLHRHPAPSLLDATAGLGTDAFMLSAWGCRASLLERSPVLYSLLADALRRAANDPKVADICARMSLQQQDSRQFLTSCRPGDFEVIYLDPMFPVSRKSALSKKGMQLLHRLLGPDQDNEGLLHQARHIAARRVVVKRRPRDAFLDEQAPDFSQTGKSARYDIYLTTLSHRADED